MKSTLITFNSLDVIAICSYFLIQYLIFISFVFTMKFFWDGYGCGEGNHKNNQDKISIMVVNKVLLSTYHPNLDERKNDYIQQQIYHILMYLQLI
jgi:hypothetical protein